VAVQVSQIGHLLRVMGKKSSPHPRIGSDCPWSLLSLLFIGHQNIFLGVKWLVNESDH